MTIDDSIVIATVAHTGMKENNGNPEVFHPIRVMMNCVGNIEDKFLVCAVLHDVIEDTGITMEYLRKRGLDDEQEHVLALLTRDVGITYFEYINKIKSDEVATIIKLYDLEDNIKRCNNESLIKRYNKAIQILTV